MKTKWLLAALAVSLTTMGFECINEDLLVAVNIKGVSGTYAVNTGSGGFNDCTTLTAGDYLNPDYTDVKDVRISDIKVSVIGTYNATINNGSSVLVNGQQILTLVAGTQWSYFSTPRSLISDPNIVKVPGGILTLVNAIKNKQDIVVCGVGSISPAPVPSGLAVKVEVFGQIDANL